MKQRIDGVTPPYEPGTDRALHRWMPPGVAREPLMLFKVLERHPELASRMRALGAGLLVHGRLSDADENSSSPASPPAPDARTSGVSTWRRTPRRPDSPRGR